MAKKVKRKGRGPRITDSELDQMLALYNEGKSFLTIAKKIKRNPQTVRKYTLIALRERSAQDLHREVLKESLLEHYRDMINALGTMMEELEMPGAADLANDGAPVATVPNIRTRLLTEGLREGHIKESPLWAWWDSWTEARRDFGQKVTTLTVNVADALDDLGRSFPKVKLEKIVHRVMAENAISSAMGTPRYSGSQLRVIPSRLGEGEEIWLGDNVMLASGPGMAKLKGRLEALLNDISEWREIKALAGIHETMVSLKGKIEEEVEVLRLRRAFPGHCRLCPV